MKRVPKIPMSEIEDRFIKGQTGQFPWNEAKERVVIPFNLRLPEPVQLKLRYMAENTPLSMHAFVMQVLEESVDREIKRLTGLGGLGRGFLTLF